MSKAHELIVLETDLLIGGVLLIAMGLYLEVSGRDFPGFRSLSTPPTADPHASDRLRWLGGVSVLFGVASLLLAAAGNQPKIVTISLLFGLGGCLMFLASLRRFGRSPNRLNKRGWLVVGSLIVLLSGGLWLQLSY